MRHALALSLLAAIVLSCDAQSALPVLALRSGDIVVEAELAVSPEDQAKGLMHRERLEDGEGMLFAYESDRRMSFWMKNTKVPLSIAFLAADGEILEIRDMEPESLEVIVSERSARHALEVPQGWFARVGLEVGERFDLTPLD